MDFTPFKETMTPGNLALYFYIDTRMEEGTVRVKCLSQQKMVMKTGKVFVVILGADPSQNQQNTRSGYGNTNSCFAAISI